MDRNELLDAMTESVVDHMQMDEGFLRDVARFYADSYTDDEIRQWLTPDDEADSEQG
jgi:hypothetical protein